MIFFTAQIKPYFIRSAIYEKNGQFIIIFADHHIEDESTNEQRNQLIKNLNNLDTDSSIAFVEDALNKYKSIIK